MRITIVALLLVTACATGYHESNLAGGFSDTQLQDDTFRVYFHGNAFTTAEEMSDYTMLRAAEVALDHGFKFFVVADQAQTTIVGAAGTRGSISIYQVGANHSQTIVCYPDKPQAMALVYDANAVYGSITTKYRIHPKTK
ncbi:MAG TPA: hypothetical protein VGH20_05160 [Myxococcales bacterium]|jgi:hypothetical protein